LAMRFGIIRDPIRKSVFSRLPSHRRVACERKHSRRSGHERQAFHASRAQVRFGRSLPVIGRIVRPIHTP
jgi:hypothetical protein